MEYAWLGLQENYQKLNPQLRFKLNFFLEIVFVLQFTWNPYGSKIHISISF